MKITKVRTAGLRGGTPEGGWTNELKPDDVVHTLVAVHTDEGVAGLGSVFSSEDLVRGAVDVLWPLLEGEDPLEPERVSEKLHRNTFWMGRGGSITHAISGLDIALWDICSRVLGQPIGRLLGGRYRDRVQPYASVLMKDPAELADELSSLAAKGFGAFKIGWGLFGRVSNKSDESIVRTAREAVGPDALLSVDAGASDGSWVRGLKWAMRTAQMLRDYNVDWFEEALPPDSLTDFAALRRGSPIPISGGEVLTRRQAFAPFLQSGAFDIVQPDTTKSGGLSESRRIGWMAQEHSVKLIPHGWNTAVGLAADMQLASALPDTDLVEYKTGSPYIDEIVTDNFSLDDDGMLPIPASPGLGVELDTDSLGRYTNHPNFLSGP